MQRLTITIPKQYNDGRDIESWIAKQIESDLLNLFDGFTRIDVYGQWKNEPGDIYTDVSYRYEILTDVTYSILREYAVRVRDILDQQSVLCTCETVRVDFI